MSEARSIADVERKQIAKYQTDKQTFNDFPVGTEVEIITPCQDFYFFYNERGKVIENKHAYLGIIVEFDEPREFEDGYIQKKFNFEPQDLRIISSQKSDFCPHCGGKL